MKKKARATTALVCLMASMYAAAPKADDTYTGIHLTVPLTFDGLGVQVVGRHGYGEVRLGLDSNGNGQAGVGFTAGNDITGSLGMAYSTFHGGAEPYLAVELGGGDWRVGAVSYWVDDETSYIYAGRRYGWGNDNAHTSQSGTDGGGDSGGGGNDDSGDDTGGDGSGDDDGGSGGGGDSGSGGSDRCGRDVGNCGNGKGRGGGNGTDNEGNGKGPQG